MQLQLSTNALTIPITIFAFCFLCTFIAGAKEDSVKPNDKAVAEEVGQLPIDIISESSGLITASEEKDIFWTMNDSGGKPTLYAVNAKGTLLKSVELPDAKNVDWEDLARDEKGNIFVGDVGKLRGKREIYTIYSLKEPKLKGDGKLETPETFEFQFPNNEKGVDVEAMVVANGKAYLFTKEFLQTRIFSVDLSENKKKKRLEATFVTEAPGKILLTGADLNVSRKRLALLSYTGVMVFELPKPWEELQAEEIKKELAKPTKQFAFFYGQVEAIAWQDTALFFTSEKGTIWKMDSGLAPQKP